MWRPDNPLLGHYRVSMWYGGLAEGAVASDVPVIVTTRTGAKELHVDETQHQGEWRELGVFEDPLNVSLTNAANGRTIVDAVQFERLP